MAAAAAAVESLPQELLTSIFLLLSCIADRIRFSAVCKHWRRVALQKPPPLPWLLMPTTGLISCYRMFGGFTGQQPSFAIDARGGRFLGSFPGGWFIVALQSWRGHALLNLLSGESVPLPDIAYFCGEMDVPVDIRAATISAAPSAGGGSGACVVGAITSVHGITGVAFWRPGMDRWSPPAKGYGVFDAEDLTYYDGWFCVLTSRERLVWYKPETYADGVVLPLKVETQHEFRDYNMTPSPSVLGEPVALYLLPCASGADLLMVRRTRFRFSYPHPDKTVFEVFRLQEQEEGPASWCPYRMNGQVIFVRQGGSKAFDTGLDHSGYIYFLDDINHGGPTSFFLPLTKYRCVDSGSYCCSTDAVKGGIKRCLPQEPSSSDCSQWIWYFH
ncbi:uncharacterized protein LOC124672171 [Lolium rigidum]|uniref:uncharacterized protein LOC124672171 n=1 Tax=Lolium rigidum TaxID=89674 RepID=UPI001F5E1608|nr:uncharacterized protein LOC124672171 [Lolium rigidum]